MTATYRPWNRASVQRPDMAGRPGINPFGHSATYTVDPAALGLTPAPGTAVVGGDPAHNAELSRRVLAGEPGPHRDIVTLNAAAGLVAAGLTDDLASGLEAARASIDGGHAAAALDRLVSVSNSA